MSVSEQLPRPEGRHQPRVQARLVLVGLPEAHWQGARAFLPGRLRFKRIANCQADLLPFACRTSTSSSRSKLFPLSLRLQFGKSCAAYPSGMVSSMLGRERECFPESASQEERRAGVASAEYRASSLSSKVQHGSRLVAPLLRSNDDVVDSSGRPVGRRVLLQEFRAVPAAGFRQLSGAMSAREEFPALRTSVLPKTRSRRSCRSGSGGTRCRARATGRPASRRACSTVLPDDCARVSLVFLGTRTREAERGVPVSQIQSVVPGDQCVAIR